MEASTSAGALFDVADYVPPRRRAACTRWLLIVAIALDAIAVVSGLAEYRLLEQTASGGGITAAEAEWNESRQAAIGLAQGSLLVVTAVFVTRTTARQEARASRLGLPHSRA